MTALEALAALVAPMPEWDWTPEDLGWGDLEHLELIVGALRQKLEEENED